jgi:hypothetical protein
MKLPPLRHRYRPRRPALPRHDYPPSSSCAETFDPLDPAGVPVSEENILWNHRSRYRCRSRSPCFRPRDNAAPLSTLSVGRAWPRHIRSDGRRRSCRVEGVSASLIVNATCSAWLTSWALSSKASPRSTKVHHRESPGYSPSILYHKR